MHSAFPAAAAVVAFTIASAACLPDPVPVAFTLPSTQPGISGAFLDAPWPSDIYVDESGLDLRTFPNPTASSTLEDVVRLFETSPAYAATTTLYFRVDGGIDESTLPATPAASIVDGSALFLVETETLRRIPLVWRQFKDGTTFLPPGTLAVQPLLGNVPRGRFALVVTSNARSPSGGALTASADMRALLECDTPNRFVGGGAAGTRVVNCGPYRQLIDDLGIGVDGVAQVQLVTPLDATSTLQRAAAIVRALPPPRVTNLLERPGPSPSGEYRVFEGTARLAQLQAGDAPYASLDRDDFRDGGFVLDALGNPEVQRFENVQFTITVPRRAQPADGYCVVVYGHGTGGDLNTGLGDGPGAEAFQAAQAGCALLTAPEPLHFTREGYVAGQEDVLTFNFFNPVAGRDNWRQSAIEKVQLVSLAQSLVIPGDVAGNGSGADIRFDPARVSYFGHSQGGISGALMVAVEERIQGAFLSGAGAGFGASLVEKVSPLSIADVIKQVLSLDAGDEIDLFHPVIALMQSWVDPADPINYGPLWRELRDGPVPHLVVSSGLRDDFTPPRCHGALAASFGLPIAAPVSEEVEALRLVGITEHPEVLEGNLVDGDGAPVTGGVLQYPEDGHFAVFNNPDAQDALLDWLTSLQEGVPRVRVQ